MGDIDRIHADQRPHFHLGVIAPFAYDPPGFGRWLGAKLATLLLRKRLTHRCRGAAVFAEPVFGHLVEYFRKAHDTNPIGDGGGPMGGYVGWLRGSLRVATYSTALVVVSPPGGMPADLRRVIAACAWLRVPVRVLAFDAHPMSAAIRAARVRSAPV